jgi:hypothetical protein
MAFSLPIFAAIAVWQMRNSPPLSVSDRWRWLDWAWLAITFRHF